MKKLLSLAALALTFCTHVPVRPDGRVFVGKLQNLYPVNLQKTVYRSEQPSAADFIAMKQQLGLCAVVKLNSALEGHDVLPDGVDFIDDWMLPAGPVALTDKLSCQRLHEIVDDIDNACKPVDVHCTLGDDRTGLVLMLWELWTKSQPIHPSAAAVWREGVAHGFHDKLYPMLVDAFVDCSGYDPRKDGAM